jgi:hypothetical protein
VGHNDGKLKEELMIFVCFAVTVTVKWKVWIELNYSRIKFSVLGRLGLTEIYAITALCRCLVGRRYASREVTVTRNYWTANHPTDKSFSRAVYQEEAEFET